MKGHDFVASGGWENSMNNKHLAGDSHVFFDLRDVVPRLFAQTLNEKQLELFEEFLHPEGL
jgi:hypothetical protein